MKLVVGGEVGGDKQGSTEIIILMEVTNQMQDALERAWKSLRLDGFWEMKGWIG